MSYPGSSSKVGKGKLYFYPGWTKFTLVNPALCLFSFCFCASKREKGSWMKLVGSGPML